MAIFDRFKRRKAQAVPAAQTKEPPAGTGPLAAEPQAVGSGRRFIGVITGPHLTEKSAGGRDQGWYTFRVRPGADKRTVRRAVEERYGVTVERVGVSCKRPRRVRLGRITGSSPGFKKAMVRIKEGQTIEFT